MRGNGHLLLVEDEARVAHTLTHFLTQMAWTVKVAPTLTDGRREFDTGLYNVVILDLMLPDGDGALLLREIRDSGSRARVVISSAIGYEREDELLKLGADIVLTKPYALELLQAAIE